MIFGFNIITGIPNKLANDIIEITGTKIGKYSHDTPKDNAIRGICINHAGGDYYLRLEVNAGVLISGKETVDIEFIKKPDFLILDENFKNHLAQMIGIDNVLNLPPMHEWIIWIMVYGMDVKVNDIDRTMQMLTKANIPPTHLIPPKIMYDADTADRKLRIYKKSEMIKSGMIDYKGKTDHIKIDDTIVRLSLIHKRSDMGIAKRCLKKADADIWSLYSFLYPPLVKHIFMKAYSDSIGTGDLRNEPVMQYLENEISYKCKMFSLYKEGDSGMADNKDNRNHSDELYTITLPGQSEKSEKIPERIVPPAKNPIPISLSLKQKKIDYYEKHGKPPVLNTSALIAKQEYFTPPAKNPINNKSYMELAKEYADQTHGKTEYIPFMCYWPSYEYMSKAQLNWYLYMRDCIRNGEYIETDLSYLFIYIYELINQIGIKSPDDGLEKMIHIWTNYRSAHSRLDNYLTDWTGDYIKFYKLKADNIFEQLKKEDLFLLMPTDMLTDYYLYNDLKIPVELIARFSDYKFYESGFIKSENGNLFIDYLSGLIHKIRCHMNEEKEGSFEKRDILVSGTCIYKKIPFQRAKFYNPDKIRIETSLPYEQHKPFRFFITAVIKEFENQLRILTKYKGRLRPDKLPDDILNICKTYAKSIFHGTEPDQKVEITIDREKLLALIQDSDEVRKRLIEGNYEYDIEAKPTHEPVKEIHSVQQESSFKSSLTKIQQKILDYLLSKNGTGTTAELNTAFPGVFIGVEVDRINDAALEKIGDLLIGFEDERWYIIEDYIDDVLRYTQNGH